jgi:hypothetical protein
MSAELSATQRRFMEGFYKSEPVRINLLKGERDKLWKEFKKTKDIAILPRDIPALQKEVSKATGNRNNLQSALLSECVYAQTLGNLLGLSVFLDAKDATGLIPASTAAKLSQSGIKARYMYLNGDRTLLLVQAGGHKGVDAALLNLVEDEITWLEFKEPGAKTSEPDLPLYGEDGLLKVDNAFLAKYPNFEKMIQEQIEKNLNLFEGTGNINDFSPESIRFAVVNNYVGSKHADIILSEDTDGFLTALPANDIASWSNLIGEIRPVGRNHRKVWTPNALLKAIKKLQSDESTHIDATKFLVPQDSLEKGYERGGTKISRLKINRFFFVRPSDVSQTGRFLSIPASKVRQIKATISVKVFMNTSMSFAAVKTHYFPEGI